jgi:hypothetical protein
MCMCAGKQPALVFEYCPVTLEQLLTCTTEPFQTAPNEVLPHQAKVRVRGCGWCGWELLTVS